MPLVRFDPNPDMEVPWTATDLRYCNMEGWFIFLHQYSQHILGPLQVH